MAPDTNETETIPSGPTRYQWPTGGRRAERNKTEANRRFLVRDNNDSSRLVKMAPRALRREKQGDNFRPVYHHGIPTKLEHKAVISAMHVHKKGRKNAATYQQQVSVARSMVSFGLSVKLFLADLAQQRMDLRHATLKAEGKWVTHKSRR